jgi:hypothetical protein
MNFHCEIEHANSLQLVSEVGFMMEDEKLQLLIERFGELKTGQEELKKKLKTEINAGQEGLKSEISAMKNDIENSISAVKGEISAVKNTSRTASEL